MFKPDLQVENLYMENSILRQRVNKMSQIQPYVNILLQNNKAYQQQINTLQLDNNKLRGKIDDILQQTIVLKQTHNNQMLALRNGLEGDVQRLVLELKDILRDKQAMQNANKTAIQQLQSRFRRQLEAKRIQIQELQSQCTHHIHKLTQNLKSKQKLLQNTKQQNKTKQRNLLEKIQKLSLQVNCLSKTKSLLEQDNNILNEEKHIMIRKNKQLLRQNQQISTNCLRTQQEKNQSIIQLKNCNRDLTEQIDQRNSQIRQLQKVIADQSRRLTNLTKQCDQISSKYNQLQGFHRRNLRQTDDLKNQYQVTSQKLQLVSKTTTLQLNQQAQKMAHILDQNKKISSDNIELQADNRDKKAQIQDLLRVVDRLQSKVKELDQNCVILQDQNNKLRDKNKAQQQQLVDCNLDRKSLNQKLTLYVTHNRTLQEVIEKEKKKNICLQNSRNQLGNIALSRGDGICKQYQQQIQKIIQDFVVQKKQTEQKHSMEISNIRKIYQNSLRQKDQYFNRKISFLQKQISTIRPLR